MSNVSEIGREGIDKAADVVIAGLTSKEPLAFISFVLLILIFSLISAIIFGGYLFIQGINENNTLVKDQSSMMRQYQDEMLKNQKEELKHIESIEFLLERPKYNN